MHLEGVTRHFRIWLKRRDPLEVPTAHKISSNS
jgi:hypothetical protein